MAFEIDIEQELAVAAEVAELLQEAAAAALRHQDASETAAITILLTDDQAIQALNRDYLGEDRPTDVLSFPAGESLPGMDEFADYLGDIALSVPYATRQAAEKGHGATAEMQLLVVHGVLHLLGYDHATPEEQREMWAVQAEILERLGLGGIAPVDDSNTFDERPSS